MDYTGLTKDNIKDIIVGDILIRNSDGLEFVVVEIANNSFTDFLVCSHTNEDGTEIRNNVYETIIKYHLKRNLFKEGDLFINGLYKD